MGAEHLLSDVKDTTVGTVTQRIISQLMDLKGLNQTFEHLPTYHLKVVLF